MPNSTFGDGIAIASPQADLPVNSTTVVLADGSRRELTGLTRDELVFLQWEQERAFAAKIVAAPKGSAARASITRQAYDTVTGILAAVRGTGNDALVMGMHPKQERLVLQLLQHQWRKGFDANLFEIGYASGKLLKCVSDAGFPVAGIEVSSAMREMAARLLPPEHHKRLYLGNFLDVATSFADKRFSLVYWNDVFEHIPPDEIGDWLAQIHRMLAPGGKLVTITPNWHARPSDVTAAICPPRSEAAGLHLQEYTLREVVRLLREAGFANIAVPLGVTSKRIVLYGNGLLGVKSFVEPALEWLPYEVAKLACRGLGLSCTVATKSEI
jgi:SAM-dependent methyltransferase